MNTRLADRRSAGKLLHNGEQLALDQLPIAPIRRRSAVFTMASARFGSITRSEPGSVVQQSRWRSMTLTLCCVHNTWRQVTAGAGAKHSATRPSSHETKRRHSSHRCWQRLWLRTSRRSRCPAGVTLTPTRPYANGRRSIALSTSGSCHGTSAGSAESHALPLSRYHSCGNSA